MPYHLTSESQYFQLMFFDAVTPQDLIVLADHIGALEQGLLVAPNRLTDLSQVAAPALTYADMPAFVERRKAQRLANSVKSAIVASEPVQFGFARMFQTLNDHPQIEIALFATLAEAEARLAMPGMSGAP